MLTYFLTGPPYCWCVPYHFKHNLMSTGQTPSESFSDRHCTIERRLSVPTYKCGLASIWFCHKCVQSIPPFCICVCVCVGECVSGCGLCVSMKQLVEWHSMLLVDLIGLSGKFYSIPWTHTTEPTAKAY